MSGDADLILVGGGLANGLIAWRLRAVRPELNLILLEGSDRLGGNHTWSFHGGDLSAQQHEWIAPLVARSWSSHDVLFPSYRRRLEAGYHSVTSDLFHDALTDALGNSVRLGARVDTVGIEKVQLADGEVLSSAAIIDGRGPRPSRALEIAYQKFVGLVVTLEAPHRLDGPILIDATVEQRDGFRFVYTLPFSQHSMLVEDTRYSDTPDLNVDGMREAIRCYCVDRGWSIDKVEREERGVLPIVLGGDVDALCNEAAGVAVSGVRAGLFHHTTGYSLPEAVRLADDLSSCRSFSSAGLNAAILSRARRLWRRQGYFRLLNRMMFRAADPERRYRVLEHFYRLPEALIERFYAGNVSWWDRMRILSGRPPVPVGRALRCLLGS